MRSCLPRQSRDWLRASGLGNTGLGLTLQDGKGGFEFVGNPFKITAAVGDVADLKKVLTSSRILFILLWNIFRREMTHVKQSLRIYNEFMVLRSRAMLCLS